MFHNGSHVSACSLFNKSKENGHKASRLHLVLSPGKESKAGDEPKSEASTPRRIGSAFSARKQSQGNDSNIRKEKLVISKKHIVIKRTPSLAISKKESENEPNEKKSKPALLATGSTSEYSTTSGSFVKLNEAILHERDKIIQLNKFCIQNINNRL